MQPLPGVTHTLLRAVDVCREMSNALLEDTPVDGEDLRRLFEKHGTPAAETEEGAEGVANARSRGRWYGDGDEDVDEGGDEDGEAAAHRWSVPLVPPEIDFW